MKTLRAIALTSFVFGICFGTHALAAQCDTETGGTLDCRPLEELKGEIGGSWCISRPLEARPIREVKSDAAWATNKDIELELQSAASATCNPAILFESKDRLKVVRDNGRLLLTITAKGGRVIVDRAELVRDSSNLWLSAVVGSIVYYVYLHDEKDTEKKISKFLVVETFDRKDAGCPDEEPRVGVTVFKRAAGAACEPALAPATPAAAHAVPVPVAGSTAVATGGDGDQVPEQFQTGVGGGGEGK